jgi:hypothetical protein
MNDMNPLFSPGDGVDQVAGAVWRSVVDNEHVETVVLVEDCGNQSLNVRSFVVGRDDDERPTRQGVSDRAKGRTR